MENGLNTSMVFKWRRDYLAGLLGEGEQAALLPVAIPEEFAVCDSETVVTQREDRCVAVAQAPSGNIEIEVNGTLVRLNGMVDASQLRLVLRCLKSS